MKKRVVIPRLAKRAEGPRARSIATAKVKGYSVAGRLIFGASRTTTVRSLAVYAARDDTHVGCRAYYSTVTLLARFRGLSTSRPSSTARW